MTQRRCERSREPIKPSVGEPAQAAPPNRALRNKMPVYIGAARAHAPATQPRTSPVVAGRVARQVNSRSSAAQPFRAATSNKPSPDSHPAVSLTTGARTWNTLHVSECNRCRRRGQTQRFSETGLHTWRPPGAGPDLPPPSYPVSEDEMTSLPPKSAEKRAGMDALLLFLLVGPATSSHLRFGRSCSTLPLLQVYSSILSISLPFSLFLLLPPLSLFPPLSEKATFTRVLSPF